MLMAVLVMNIHKQNVIVTNGIGRLSLNKKFIFLVDNQSEE